MARRGRVADFHQTRRDEAQSGEAEPKTAEAEEKTRAEEMAGGGGMGRRGRGLAGEYRGGREKERGEGAERGEGQSVIHFTSSLFILDK